MLNIHEFLLAVLSIFLVFIYFFEKFMLLLYMVYVHVTLCFDVTRVGSYFASVAYLILFPSM